MPTPVTPFTCVTVACYLYHACLGHGGEGEAVRRVTHSTDGIKVAASALYLCKLHYGASVFVVDDDDADDGPFGSFLLCASCSLALSSDTFTRITVNAGKRFADTDNVPPSQTPPWTS